ncbi:protein HU [uncultured phage cr106_1]|uniref:Protein HU n=1 Tax=uncultured phage cr106_1 TaxID=2772062 RepID=A0A7M1RV23_9CAUD|nr:protein HU [uncultured phage cr106_1]QOR58277.1 protein HU [uncultured phage cr106_1]
MIYSEALKQVSNELEIPVEVVKEAYESYWKFIRESIKSLPLKEDLTKEEFDKLRTNFNIPSIGKLSCTYDRMIGVKKKFKHIKKLRDGRFQS